MNQSSFCWMKTGTSYRQTHPWLYIIRYTLYVIRYVSKLRYFIEFGIMHNILSMLTESTNRMKTEISS